LYNLLDCYYTATATGSKEVDCNLNSLLRTSNISMKKFPSSIGIVDPGLFIIIATILELLKDKENVSIFRGNYASHLENKEDSQFEVQFLEYDCEFQSKNLIFCTGETINFPCFVNTGMKTIFEFSVW
jgi:hypothetical protein